MLRFPVFALRVVKPGNAFQERYHVGILYVYVVHTYTQCNHHTYPSVMWTLSVAVPFLLTRLTCGFTQNKKSKEWNYASI